MFLFLLEIAVAIPTEAATRSSAVDFSLLFIKMIAALVVAVVLAILLIKYVMPKLSFAKGASGVQDIKILSRFSLSSKQHLYLVKAKEKCILLGVTDQNINKIAELEGSDEEQKEI